MYGCRYYDGSPRDQESDILKFLRKVQIISRFDRKSESPILARAIDECREFGRKLILDRFLDDRYWRGQLKVDKIVEENENRCRQAEWELDTRQDYALFLELTFDRLRVLRNQIMHGCSTQGTESKGYKSLQFAVRFLKVIIPVFYVLVDLHGEHVKWEKAPYPRKDHVEHPWK